MNRLQTGIVLPAAGFAALLALPWILDAYTLSTVASWLYLSLAVLSLTVLVGVSGQISVGHAAFVGASAYMSTILVADYQWNLWLACAAAIVSTMVLGAIVSLPALRMSGLYIAVPTIGLALVFPTWLQAAREVTGGYSGKALAVQIVPPPWTGLDAAAWVYVITVIAVAVCFVLVACVVDSRIGRALRAVRTNESVAETFGARVASLKVSVFVLSAGLAGVAGCLFTLQRQFVSPADFTLLLAISLFTGMAIGGQFSVWGALVGGAFLQYAQGAIEDIGVDPLLVPALYGALLIVIVIKFRAGVAGAIHTGIVGLGRLIRPVERGVAPAGDRGIITRRTS